MVVVVLEELKDQHYSDGGVGGGANGRNVVEMLHEVLDPAKVLQTLVVVEVVVVHLVDLDGNGSSGIVIVRYPIGSVEIPQKQLVVLLVLANNMTVHTFLGSGEFITTV